MPESLKQRDFKALQHCIAELYELGDLEQFKGRMVRALAPVVAGDATIYAEIDVPRRTITWDADDEASPLNSSEAMRAFATHIRELPTLGSYRRGQGSAVKISDGMSVRQLHRTAIYNNFYRRDSINHHIMKGVPGPPGMVSAVGILRRRPDFTERDRLLLNLLGPHLNRAYENATATTRMAVELSLLRRGLEALDHGILLVAPDGRVTAMSDRARGWCARYFGRAGAERLPDALRRWMQRHDDELARRDDAIAPPAPLQIVQESRELTVRLVRDGGQRLLLLSEQDCTPRPERLEALGLSRREAEVLAWVAEGKANGDIATILGASVRTIEKHMERVFRKLGVETRTAAAARALAVLTS
jgi:DNA-binding CsgD family transcriptional regulator